MLESLRDSTVSLQSWWWESYLPDENLTRREFDSYGPFSCGNWIKLTVGVRTRSSWLTVGVVQSCVTFHPPKWEFPVTSWRQSSPLPLSHCSGCLRVVSTCELLNKAGSAPLRSPFFRPPLLNPYTGISHLRTYYQLGYEHHLKRAPFISFLPDRVTE